jgi:hypothetical protein
LNLLYRWPGFEPRTASGGSCRVTQDAAYPIVRFLTSSDSFSGRFGNILADVGAVGADALDSSIVSQDANANTLRDGSSQAQNNNWFVGWSNDTVKKNASETKTVL